MEILRESLDLIQDVEDGDDCSNFFIFPAFAATVTRYLRNWPIKTSGYPGSDGLSG